MLLSVACWLNWGQYNVNIREKMRRRAGGPSWYGLRVDRFGPAIPQSTIDQDIDFTVEIKDNQSPLSDL